MKFNFLIIALLFFGIITTSCNKEGIGGDNTLAVFPEHHGKPIYGATVYVRFAGTEFPGSNPSDYDLAEVGDSSEEHVHIKGLRKGNYYLYATGFDSSISAIVTGGVHIKLNKKSGETDVKVPVVE